MTMTQRRNMLRTWPGAFVFIAIFMATLPYLSEAGTKSTESQGILHVPDYSGNFWSQSHLTGDWGGIRNDLANKGVQTEIRWNQTVQSVVEGGRDTGTEYGGSFLYDLNLDLMRMGILPGALVKFRAESRYGESVNDRTGQILPANLDGLMPLTKSLDDNIGITVTNLNYTQFLSDHIGLTVGKYDTLDGDPNEFAGGRGLSQFMNLNFVLSAPLALIVPYSTLGFGMVVIPNKHLTISSLLINTADSSTSTGFHDIGDGSTWTTEVQSQYRLGRLPGGANLGFAYAFDNEFAKLNGRFSFRPGEGITAPKKDESWVVYMSAWQYLYTEDADAGPVNLTNGQPDHQGVGLFTRLSFADEDTNPVEFSASVGLGGRGIIPSRDNDTFGIGYFYINLQKTRIGGLLNLENSSQGFETFYNLAVTPAAGLTFNLQVLDSPNPANDTAVVLGTRLNLRF